MADNLKLLIFKNWNSSVTAVVINRGIRENLQSIRYLFKAFSIDRAHKCTKCNSILDNFETLSELAKRNRREVSILWFRIRHLLNKHVLLRINLMKNQIVLKAFTAIMILERYLNEEKKFNVKIKFTIKRLCFWICNNCISIKKYIWTDQMSQGSWYVFF